MFELILRGYINYVIPCLLLVQLFDGRMDYSDTFAFCGLVLFTLHLFRRSGLWKLTYILLPGTIYLFICYSFQVNIVFVAVPYAVLLVRHMDKYIDSSASMLSEIDQSEDLQVPSWKVVVGLVRFVCSVALVCIPIFSERYATAAYVVFMILWAGRAYKAVSGSIDSIAESDATLSATAIEPTATEADKKETYA